MTQWVRCYISTLCCTRAVHTQYTVFELFSNMVPYSIGSTVVRNSDHMQRGHMPTILLLWHHPSSNARQKPVLVRLEMQPTSINAQWTGHLNTSDVSNKHVHFCWPWSQHVTTNMQVAVLWISAVRTQRISTRCKQMEMLAVIADLLALQFCKHCASCTPHAHAPIGSIPNCYERASNISVALSKTAAK